jgi:hypothetical protein
MKRIVRDEQLPLYPRYIAGIWDKREIACQPQFDTHTHEMFMKRTIYLLLCLVPMLVSAALPIGDTQGIVTAVRVKLPVGNVHSFEVWFAAAPTNDRWACVAANGWVLVKEDSPGMTLDNYKRIFALALTAQASGKELAIDSAASSPCVNGIVAWMVN